MENNLNLFPISALNQEEEIQHNDISIKIKSMDNEFMVNISAQANIEQLKQKIEIISKVPVDRQRLIFRGKLLKNEESITVSKITNLDVVHLVAKIGEINTTQQETTSLQSQRRATNTFMSFMNNIVRNETANEYGVNSARRTRAVNDQNAGVVQFNESECKEAIAQNILQINNIFECGNFNEENNQQIDYHSDCSVINCFDLSKRKIVKGQWVDVKDTVDQWLEAQVINVKDNSVQIHYNRWGTRWDEWIDMNSDRIMPFRFHTRQASITNYSSPFPNSKPDAPNVSLITSQQNDTSSNQNMNILNLFDDVMAINQKSISLFQKTKENPLMNKEQNQLETICNMKQLLPIFDKMGRIYIDMSAYINNALKKNKLEDLNKQLFQDANKNNELLKPYASDEQKVVNDELMNQYSQRTIRSNTLHFIPPSNKLDRKMTNQIPLIDTPLTTSNRSLMLQPILDVYVHTFVYPSTIIVSRGISDNQTNSPMHNSSTINNAEGENQEENNHNNDKEKENGGTEENVEEKEQNVENKDKSDNNNSLNNTTNINNTKSERIEEPKSRLGKKRQRSKNKTKVHKKSSEKSKENALESKKSFRNNKRDRSNKKNK